MSQSIYGSYPSSWPLIAEGRRLLRAEPHEMDELWDSGWRHFGPEFFRASLMADEMSLKRQVPLRVRLAGFRLSKSQRRTMRRNDDLQVEIAPAMPGAEEEALFNAHRERFDRNVPLCLEEFLGRRPDGQPCRSLQLSVRKGGRLVAASFLALGRVSCSSVYAVFDPREERRRLGIYTMLLELDHARREGLEFVYTGYATIEPSCYDYKKQFRGLEFYRWDDSWCPIEELPM